MNDMSTAAVRAYASDYVAPASPAAKPNNDRPADPQYPPQDKPQKRGPRKRGLMPDCAGQRVNVLV